MTAYDNVKFSYGGVVVFIATQKVEENYTNAVKPINIPTTGSTPETTKLINLNKMEDRFTITGSLNYGKLDASETYTSAINKKSGLKTMVAQGSVIVMTYEGVAYNVAVDKYQITDQANDNSDSMDEEVVYDVTISCVVGADLV